MINGFGCITTKMHLLVMSAGIYPLKTMNIVKYTVINTHVLFLKKIQKKQIPLYSGKTFYKVPNQICRFKYNDKFSISAIL